MEKEPVAVTPDKPTPPYLGIDLSKAEMTRTFIFLAIQVCFLIVSPFTGGFHMKVWSMLDSAILIASIGITGLVFVLDSVRARRTAFKIAIGLYLAAVIDMSINILLTGWLGWEKLSLGATSPPA